MRILRQMSAFALFLGIAAGIGDSEDRHGLVVTASNTPANNLLVYNTSNRLIQTVATGGAGGASGNAGGIAASHGRLAVVNFASQNVSMFERSERGFRLKQTVPTASNPLSVAFGHGHLYILGSTWIESHQVFDFGVAPGPDCVAELVIADGSARKSDYLNGN